jgi:hypothetical protein
MSVRNLLKLCVRLLAVPLLAAYGAWTLVAAGYRLARRGSGAARLLGRSLPCPNPNCGAQNLLDGRWRCRSCGAEYLGFVVECPLCGSGASFISCERCRVSISLTGHLP